jgi:hypothetical protein
LFKRQPEYPYVETFIEIRINPVSLATCFKDLSRDIALLIDSATA